MTFNNGLTQKKTEALGILIEELGELQQIAGKILRHGYDSKHPDCGTKNTEWMAKEMGDVIAAIDIIIKDPDNGHQSITRELVQDYRERKMPKIKQWLHHIKL